MNPILLPLSIMAVCTSTIAQEQRPDDDEGHRPPPPLPVFDALDQDGDHRLSEEEIENASEILRELDRDGDGQLAPHELHPPRPDGDHPDRDHPRPPMSEHMDGPPPWHPPHHPRGPRR